ncbi:hypothetical protein L596_000377 [Steinernema carpocapsae]|uniref:Uncharacterized protein n=1 Tax=Steinernema carpocapsae TaxID=34508 RepID=A0A4U8UHZ4_STECR|nr:hypothetical protein L596_000377 [Steinernema carpocapsae]
MPLNPNLKAYLNAIFPLQVAVLFILAVNYCAFAYGISDEETTMDVLYLAIAVLIWQLLGVIYYTVNPRD